MITPITPLKNAIANIQRASRNGFDLLMEDGFFLLTEASEQIMLDQTSYGLSAINTPKNMITPINTPKS